MFFKKKDDKEELKKAILGEESVTESFLSKEEPPEENESFEDLFIENKKPTETPKEKPDTETVREVVSVKAEPAVKQIQPIVKSSMPLYVKVEDYKRLVSALQEIKVLLNGIKQIFSIFSEIDMLRDDALKLVNTSIHRVEGHLLTIDSIVSYETSQPIETVQEDRIEKSLESLQKQLRDLKVEIEKVKE